jgi:capsular polysaccharide biosynthesis protein
VDSATLAPQPIRPHRLLNLAACLAAGGLMGCGLATYRYSGRRTIDTPEDVEEELQLPVLGIVPRNA